MTILSSRYDHDPSHFRFVRTHTGAPPTPSNPISSYGTEVLRLLGVVAMGIAILALLSLFSA